jgi:hypothetical protein
MAQAEKEVGIKGEGKGAGKKGKRGRGEMGGTVTDGLAPLPTCLLLTAHRLIPFLDSGPESVEILIQAAAEEYGEVLVAA